MTCLPIARRELQVAARKRSTFWVRAGAAGTALLIGSGCLILTHWQRAGRTEIGSILFHVLTWLSFGAGISAGLFFTSDALSEEKRDGTLGLLFLTDLRGYDVGLGKLLATSMRGFHGLLAVLPIVAITLLMGGVTGNQYWRSSLALVDALFFSLAAGLLISAMSRDSQKALAATMLVLLLLAAGGPTADAIIAEANNRVFEPFWSLSSPAYVLATATAWGRSAYWDALLVTHLLAWAMFGLACTLVPHTWQEKKHVNSGHTRTWAYALKYGGHRRRERLRRKVLESRPVVWLACRERWQSLGLWAIAIVAMAGFVVALVRTKQWEGWLLWSYLGGFFTLLLYLLMASQAGRFGVEARRTGFVELLLVSPLPETEIVLGQWRALLRMFGAPLALLVLLQVTGAALSQLSWHRMAVKVNTVAAAATATNQSGAFTNAMTVASTTSVASVTITVPGRATTNTLSTSPFPAFGAAPSEVMLTVVRAVASASATVANLLALWWFGMWMGMTSRTANLATLKTIVFVQVAPWFVITFGATLLVGLLMMSASWRTPGAPAASFMWWPVLTAVVSASLALIKDIVFIIWSRRKLYHSFREQATGASRPIRPVLPPPLPTSQPEGGPPTASGAN